MTSIHGSEKEIHSITHSKSAISPHLMNKTVQMDNVKHYEEEQIEHVHEGTASNRKALFLVLKAFIGTGVIFLPGGFVNGGLILSILLMLVIAAICMVAFYLLIQAQRMIGGDYGHIAYQLYGQWLRYLILFFLCFSQMGFASSYLIFVSQNLGLVVDQLSHCHRAFPSNLFIWLVLLIIVPICMVRKIEKLSWNVIIADVFILFGLISVIYFTSDQISNNGIGPNLKMVNTSNFALMIGTAVFSFEGIGMVVPIIQGMKHPEQFSKVLNMGMIICTCLFILIGTLGYIAYGENTHASVVSNLPHQNGLAITVQLFYAIAIILSSPFVLFPPLTIIEHGIFGTNHSGRLSLKYKWCKNLVRALIPIICAVVSYCVGAAGLDRFVALTGSIACVPLCFIFPGMFHFKIATSKTQRAIDIIMILFGMGIMIYTTYVNVNSWIHPPPTSESDSNNTCPL